MAIPLERLSVQSQLSQNLKASGKRNVYLAFHNWPQLWHPFGSPNSWNIFYFFNPSFSCPLPISVNILGFREMKLLWLMASQLVLVVFLQNRNCRQRLPNFYYLPKKKLWRERDYKHQAIHLHSTFEFRDTYRKTKENI